MDEDKLTFIILAPNPASSKSLDTLPPDPPLDELFQTNSGLSPTDKRLTDDFQMIGDVNIFLTGAIPQSPPQSSSPQVHLATSSGNSNVSSLHLFAEAKDSEEDIDGGDGDFQAEVEIMIAGTYILLFLLL